ncbi:hypothetical protein ACP70R_027008 [Stipagrostis hirtigluma subsp. patula]
MGMVTRSQRRRLIEEEERLDRISCLPDDVLGEIVSLLPTKDGARTQVLSSRWRPLWRSAPLNVDLHGYIPGRFIETGDISRILSAHPGPGRRFAIPSCYLPFGGRPVATLDAWLQSPAVDNLRELEIHYSSAWPGRPQPPLPASTRRFSPTLTVASFDGCCFPDSNNAGALHLPVLKQLRLLWVRVSDSSLHALLANCPALEILLLSYCEGCSRVRIVSHTLKSIGVKPGGGDLHLQQLILEDAPVVERLLFVGKMDILVISAPRLSILGELSDDISRLKFSSTGFQGQCNVGLAMVVCGVKILALTNMRLSLDAVINFMKFFPCLEKLYITTITAGKKNVWCHKYRSLIGSLNIRLKKLVLINYRGNKSHVNFVKFFILNARVLESMILELESTKPTSAWIERQHRLLQTKNRVSTGLHIEILYHDRQPGPLGWVRAAVQALNLSTADPFVRFRDWSF